jgi:hypothetical protein
LNPNPLSNNLQTILISGINVPVLSSTDEAGQKLVYHEIANDPWGNGSSDCAARFKIGHTNTQLFLKYRVEEQFLRVKTRANNDSVHFDNCVELFFAFPGDDHYYNLEFNCLGSVKAAFGRGRTNRKPFPDEVVNRIADNISITLNNINAERKICWELTVLLPIDIFIYHKYQSFSGLSCRGNFTKCGEKLPDPHFLSWSNIHSAKPDFHQKEFFGEILFDPSQKEE